MFIVHAYDDPVDCRNSLLLANELKAIKINCELHIYATGGHGYGMRHRPPDQHVPAEAGGMDDEAGVYEEVMRESQDRNLVPRGDKIPILSAYFERFSTKLWCLLPSLASNPFGASSLSGA